ncbi:hypothetical protein JCM33374_g4611 [Metschnikowia sp. JCM 33374]|nr:hypothetical protein JCM33374_g4611 [Metschnikowia sp. JCM 33374]
MSALSLRNELDLLKKEKTDAQRKNHLEAAKYRNSQRDAVSTDTDDTNTTAPGDESRGYETENLPHDPMDWTAQQWAKLDKPQLQSQQKAAFSGYKDMTSLASATYAKETAKRYGGPWKVREHQTGGVR